MNTLRFSLTSLVFLGLLVAAVPHAGAEGKRVALLIACADYDYDDLDLGSPAHDVVAMRKMLAGSMGFDVVLTAGISEPVVVGDEPKPVAVGFNAFHRALATFKREAAGAELALFYYSGHGIGGLVGDEHTYLMPTDARLDERAGLRSEVISTETLLRDLKGTGARTRVAVLDCCRDNPFLKTKGWVQTKSTLRDLVLSQLGEASIPPATLVAYATSPGRKAAAVFDEGSRLSPYTAALVRKLPTPGLSLRDAFERAHDAVADATEHRQVPKLDYDSAARVLRELVLVPASAALRALPVEPKAVTPATASKTRPYVNALGMEFVPAGTPGVLFCRWETRLQDFRAFVESEGFEVGLPMYGLATDLDIYDIHWKGRAPSWIDPGFPQGDLHPVVGINHTEARAFCAWLTRVTGVTHRLPRDSEWSRAVGAMKYPWGDSYPPDPRDGNFASTEAKDADWPEGYSIIEDFSDGHGRTAPVASYRPNAWGLYDVGGNVWEWCEDWYVKTMNSAELRKQVPALENDKGGETYRVVRGGSWLSFTSSNVSSSCRSRNRPSFRVANIGFRVVLELGGDG